MNLLLIANLISLSFSSSNINFSMFAKNATDKDVILLKENSINDFESYFNYLENNYEIYNSGSNNNGGSIITAIEDPKNYLNEKYSNYYWVRDEDNTALTSDVSNAIPIEMQSKLFSDKEIEEAIIKSNVQKYTSYGGCGPIAVMGILEYFARYLNYNEIIKDPTDSSQRIDLATKVLENTSFSKFSKVDETLVWPWDLTNTFNEIIKMSDLNNKIVANNGWTLFGNEKEKFWKIIVKSIDEGIPVTMFTGLECGDGDFSQHYTNIYGYETWVGVPTTGGERLKKQFIKARLNFAKQQEFYCDADILNCPQIGLIRYTINYENSYEFNENDFSEQFINSNGNGQYFYYNLDAPVTLSNGKILQTNRLRASYIENQYLVLSPNRKDAGKAYIDLSFPNNVSRLSFDSSLWSSLEGISKEQFTIEYFQDNTWKSHININLNNLSTFKDDPDDFVVLFPNNINRIRFLAMHDSPSGDRNKGRICLDNFKVSYN